ncbi:MAG: hypothetical protein ACR2P0_04905 [Acidimicrobiales bacterium]
MTSPLVARTAIIALALAAAACGSGAGDDLDVSTNSDQLVAETSSTNDASEVRAVGEPDDVQESSSTTTIPGSLKTDSESADTTTAAGDASDTTDVIDGTPTTTATSGAGSTTTTGVNSSSSASTTIAGTGTTTAPPTSASTPSTTTTVSTATSSPPTTVSQIDRIDLPTSIGSTEGIAADSSTGRIFVGELNNGNIWVGDLGGSFSLFASGSAHGRATALGMTIDAARRRLYVASPANARVDVINADSGSLIASVTIPSGGSTVNDVVAASDGTVYATDTAQPHVYRIPNGSTTAELWVDYAGSGAVDTSGTQHGNGIEADASRVLVTHMVTGTLLRIDRSSGAVSSVPISGASTAGRDGLVRCGNRLIGVDINSLAGGVDTVWVTQLTDDWTSGSNIDAIRSASMSSASTAALVSGQLVVVNAQFGVSPPTNPYWLSVFPSPC